MNMVHSAVKGAVLSQPLGLDRLMFVGSPQSNATAFLGSICGGVDIAGTGIQAIRLLTQRSDDYSVVLLDEKVASLGDVKLEYIISQAPALKHISIIKRVSDGGATRIEYDGVSYSESSLIGVVQTAFSDSKKRKFSNMPLVAMDAVQEPKQLCRYRIRTFTGLINVAWIASTFFSEPNRAYFGLYELLANALEHGILQLGHHEKTKFRTISDWRTYVDMQLAQPEHQGKCCEVVVVQRSDGVYAVITDDGEGFNWELYTSETRDGRSDCEGRGIMNTILMSFDSVSYNRKGNRVVACMRSDSSFDW